MPCLDNIVIGYIFIYSSKTTKSIYIYILLKKKKSIYCGLYREMNAVKTTICNVWSRALTYYK